MNILFNLIFSFYPTAFIYQSIPDAYIKKLDALAPSGFLYFALHLALFGFIFFVSYVGTKKFIFLGFGEHRRGFLAVAAFVVLTLALAAITFWNILPGSTVYEAPALIEKYLLSNPWNLIALILPFVYFFFD